MQTFKFWSLTVGRPSQLYGNTNKMKTVISLPIPSLVRIFQATILVDLGVKTQTTLRLEDS